MFRRVKLFIVTYSPLLGDIARCRLGLVMRRNGPLVQMNEAVMQHSFLGQLEPIISMPIRGTMCTEEISARIFAGVYLGKEIERILDPENGKVTLKKFECSEKTTSDEDLTIFGAFIPNAVEIIRAKSLYGCIDIMTRDQIESEKKLRRKHDQEVVTRIFRNVAEIVRRRKETMLDSLDYDLPDIDADDLAHADKILAHFQKEFDKEYAKKMKKVNRTSYAARSPNRHTVPKPSAKIRIKTASKKSGRKEVDKDLIPQRASLLLIG